MLRQIRQAATDAQDTLLADAAGAAAVLVLWLTVLHLPAVF